MQIGHYHTCFGTKGICLVPLRHFMSVIDYDDVIYMDALSESLLMLDSVYHGALIQYKGLYSSLYAVCSG